ncbi:regulator of G-protein signaling 8-like [Boleophthalmus pectinirostris]|uniref:regulator of G-protein signaling 8-like n=1 Tax=Boleophthalmus pectinirostris TaxID=150288 RepID=UPI002432255E|nr:regulator of G-protein signaling 8-like [Boleophthalmus pectinirostris]
MENSSAHETVTVRQKMSLQQNLPVCVRHHQHAHTHWSHTGQSARSSDSKPRPLWLYKDDRGHTDTQRLLKTMREVGLDSNTMALTQHMAEFNTEKKNIRRKSWKNRITLLLKKNTHLMKNKPYRPSTDDLQHWGQSLDHLLSHKYGKAAFFIFMKSEFCEENIEFWSKCEEYQALSSMKHLKARANSIYEEYVCCEAPKEINLDYQTRNAITAGLDNPGPTLFLQAQWKVYSLMENNAYPRFLQSDFYRDLCSTATGEPKRIKAESKSRTLPKNWTVTKSKN